MRVASVYSGQSHEDPTFHFISSAMTGAAQLYVKGRGAQLCEQTPLIRIQQSLPKVIKVMKSS